MLIRSSHSLIKQLTSIREGETKLSEVMHHLEEDMHSINSLKTFLESRTEKYILLGIPEDIGIRANAGKAGTAKAFDCFLSYFLNIQFNQFIDPSKFLLLGAISVEDLQAQSQSTTDLDELRNLCSEVDERVFPVIKTIVLNKKIPIIIGGGHNNSYGILKGASMALGNPIECLNIDPHLDCRTLEGRHSGNGFSFAQQEGFLSKYFAFGIHENYNNQFMLDSVKSFAEFETLENVKIRKNVEFRLFLKKMGDEIGVELDLDSIKDMPCSAMTPSGFSEEEIRAFFYQIFTTKKPVYYHLPEGSPREGLEYKVGKFLSYLVSDIVKG